MLSLVRQEGVWFEAQQAKGLAKPSILYIHSWQEFWDLKRDSEAARVFADRADGVPCVPCAEDILVILWCIVVVFLTAE